MKKIIQIVCISIILIFIGACDKNEEEIEPTKKNIEGVGFEVIENTIVGDDVIFVTAETNELILQSVESDKLIFSSANEQISNLKPGDILLADASENNPNGYARKVVSVSQEKASNIVVETEYAKISECYDEFDIAQKLDITPESEFISYDYFGNGVKQSLKSLKKTKELDFGVSYDTETKTLEFKRVVYDSDNSLLTETDQVVYTGSIQFLKNDLKFHTYLSLDRKLKVSVGGELELKIINEVAIKSGLKFEKRICIGSIIIAPLSTGVINTYLSFYIGVNGEVSAEFSVKNTSTLYTGAVIQNHNDENRINCFGKVRGSNTLEITEPKLELNAKAYVAMAMEIKFLKYPDAKLSLEARGYVFSDVVTNRTPLWQFGYGREAVAQAKLQVLGNIIDIEAEYVFGAEEEITDEGGKALNIIPPVLTYPIIGSMDVERDLTLRWEKHESLENVAVKYNVYLGKDNDPISLIASDITNTFLSTTLEKESNYYWKVEIIDEEGNKETSQLSSFVTGNDNLPPNAFEMIYPEHDMTDVTSSLFSWNATTDPDGDNVLYNIRVIDLEGSNTVIFSDSDLSETQVEVTGLENDKRYTVIVGCYDDKGGYTETAAVFYTGIIGTGNNTEPTIPLLSSPVNNANDQGLNLDLSWTESTDDDGDPIVYDVYLGTESTPVTIVSANQSVLTYAASDLVNNTVYYWKIVAKDDKGGETESAIWSFTTEAAIGLPSLSTDAVSSITETTATSGGNITNDGGATVTARGVCWSTNSSPTIADNYTSDGSGTGAFTSSLTGLSAETTYYIRSYATNSSGTAYGTEQNFTTKQVSIEPTVNSVSPLTATIGTETTFTVSGANLTSDLLYHIDDLEGKTFVSLSADKTEFKFSIK